MKTLFPSSFMLAFILLIIQTYLLVYLTLLLLRRLKLLKKPYGGMDYAESLPAAVILLGVLIISSGDVYAIFQTAKIYIYGNGSAGEAFYLFFVRSFTIILIFCVLFIAMNFLNIRYLFRGHFQAPALPVSIIICSITIGLAAVFWLSSREVIDNMTPKIINFP
jgi:hypothetical protein